MTYRCNWTDDRLPVWMNYARHLKGEPVKALEIGAFEGRSTVWILENILTHPDARIVCLDPFVPNKGLDLPADVADNYLARFVENTKFHRSKVRILQAYSWEVTAEWLAPFGPFDLVYVDASHWPEETVREAEMAWQVCKPGALLIFDDYGGTLKEYIERWRVRAEKLHESQQMISRVVK